MRHGKFTSKELLATKDYLVKMEEHFGFPKKGEEEEAWNRTKLIDYMEEKLRGGLHEFLRSKILTKNGITGYSAHWMKESRRLVEREFREAFLHKVKGVSNYDTIFDQAKKAVQRNQIRLARYAGSIMKKEYEPKYKTVFKVLIDDNDFAEFWLMVDASYADVKVNGLKGEKAVKNPPTRKKDFK